MFKLMNVFNGMHACVCVYLAGLCYRMILWRRPGSEQEKVEIGASGISREGPELSTGTAETKE